MEHARNVTVTIIENYKYYTTFIETTTLYIIHKQHYLMLTNSTLHIKQVYN